MLAAVNWTKWSAVGTIAAALATVLLAFATWRLVRATKAIVAGTNEESTETKRLAEATREQAQIAAHALALQVEPRIVPLHEEWPHFAPSDEIGGTVGQHRVSPLLIAIENAGAGVAQLIGADVQVSGFGPPDVHFPGVVRPDSQAFIRAEFTVPPTGYTSELPMTISPGTTVNVRVRYRDGGSREYELAFRWNRPAGSESRWRLTLLEDIGHPPLPESPEPD